MAQHAQGAGCVHYASAALNGIANFLFFGFWTMLAFGAQAFLSNPANEHYFANVLPGALLLILLYWQISPVLTATMGRSLELTKLIVYPIPHDKLFLVELLLRITTCAEMLIVLAGIGIGLTRNPNLGGLRRIPQVAVITLLFIVFNVLLSAGIRTALERLFSKKRWKEVMMFLIFALAIAPQYLLQTGFRPKNFESLNFPDAPYLVWSATSQLLLHTGGIFSMATLAVAVLAAFGFARWQFETNLRRDSTVTASNSVRSGAGPQRWEWLLSWPSQIFPDPIAAIMEKEFRSLFRTPQFRFVFLTCSAFGLIMCLPRLIGDSREPDTFFYRNVVVIVSVYAVLLLGQVSYFNCFGYERSAAQAWFSYPVPIRLTLIAKNLSAACFVLMELVMVTLATALLRFPLSAGKFLENVIATLIAALYLIAFGNIASVRIPRALMPERISQSGANKARNASTALLLPVVLTPIVLAYWTRSVVQSETAFAALLTFAALLGAALYAIGLSSAVRTADTTREKILEELSKGEGPVSQ